MAVLAILLLLRLGCLLCHWRRRTLGFLPDYPVWAPGNPGWRCVVGGKQQEPSVLRDTPDSEDLISAVTSSADAERAKPHPAAQQCLAAGCGANDFRDSG
jgi:hypothetical protein